MSSKTPLIKPIVPNCHVQILNDEQLADLKSATLELLEEVSVHCPIQKALTIYAGHGARVDFEEQIVRLPGEVVVEAMSHVPRYYITGARSAAHKLVLDEMAMYYTTDGGEEEKINVTCEKTDWILANHHPEPLTEDQQAEFNRILRAAEGEMG